MQTYLFSESNQTLLESWLRADIQRLHTHKKLNQTLSLINLSSGRNFNSSLIALLAKVIPRQKEARKNVVAIKPFEVVAPSGTPKKDFWTKSGEASRRTKFKVFRRRFFRSTLKLFSWILITFMQYFHLKEITKPFKSQPFSISAIDRRAVSA